jgi:hypothetical protein
MALREIWRNLKGGDKTVRQDGVWQVDQFDGEDAQLLQARIGLCEQVMKDFGTLEMLGDLNESSLNRKGRIVEKAISATSRASLVHGLVFRFDQSLGFVGFAAISDQEQQGAASFGYTMNSAWISDIYHGRPMREESAIVHFSRELIYGRNRGTRLQQVPVTGLDASNEALRTAVFDEFTQTFLPGEMRVKNIRWK